MGRGGAGGAGPPARVHGLPRRSRRCRRDGRLRHGGGASAPGFATGMVVGARGSAPGAAAVVPSAVLRAGGGARPDSRWPGDRRCAADPGPREPSLHPRRERDGLVRLLLRHLRPVRSVDRIRPLHPDVGGQGADGHPRAALRSAIRIDGLRAGLRDRGGRVGRAGAPPPQARLRVDRYCRALCRGDGGVPHVVGRVQLAGTVHRRHAGGLRGARRLRMGIHHARGDENRPGCRPRRQRRHQCDAAHRRTGGVRLQRPRRGGALARVGLPDGRSPRMRSRACSGMDRSRPWPSRWCGRRLSLPPGSSREAPRARRPSGPARRRLSPCAPSAWR